MEWWETRLWDTVGGLEKTPIAWEEVFNLYGLTPPGNTVIQVKKKKKKKNSHFFLIGLERYKNFIISRTRGLQRFAFCWVVKKRN
jgi:hypothetical protein